MDTTFPCSATKSSSCSFRLGVIQARTPLIRFSRMSERKTPRDGERVAARGEAPWRGGGGENHGGIAHAAFFLGTKMPGSAFKRPPVSCWIWSCLNGGGYIPQPAMVDWAMPNALASFTCVL